MSSVLGYSDSCTGLDKRACDFREIVGFKKKSTRVVRLPFQ